MFLWLAWLIAYFIVGNDYLLPSFWETISATWQYLADGAFWRAFAGTLLRTFCAFVISLILGTGFAALSRLCGRVRAFFAPVISLLRTLPTLAVILILLLWTSPTVAPVIVSLFVLFPAVYASALSAFDEVGEEYGELARAFCVSGRRKIFKMYLPLAAPPVLKQSGAIFSLGLKITVSGEVLASTYRSLGGLMQEAKMYVQMPQLLALTLLCILLGFLLEGACALVYRLTVRWRA